MIPTKTTLVLVLSLWSPAASAVRGVRGSRKEATTEIRDDSPQLEDADLLASRTNEVRSLHEDVPCVSFDSLSAVAVANHELTDPLCWEDGCGGGCCRLYYWLICDRDNAFPDIPCICNAHTQDPAFFGGTASLPASTVVTGEFNNLTALDENITVSSAFEEGWYLLETEEEEFHPIVDVAERPNPILEPDLVAAITQSPTFAPLTVSPTNPTTPAPTTISPTTAPPTGHPTIPPDACAGGSPYASMSGFSSYASCVTSLDCLGISSASRSRPDVNNHDAGGLVAETFKKDNKRDEDEAEESVEEAESVEDNILLSAQQQGEEPAWCCLSQMCLCGIPPNGDYYGNCVPPYVVPETPVPTKAPTEAPIATPGPTEAPVTVVFTEKPVTPSPTTPSPTSASPTTPSPTTALPASPAPTKEAVPESAPGNSGNQAASGNPATDGPTTEGTPEDVPVTECTGGSWYHQEPVFQGYKTCVTTSECRQADEADCCLKDFCFCGKVGPGGEAKACVADPDPTDTMVYPEVPVTPVPTTPNPTTASPTTPAPVPAPTSPSPTTALPTSPAPTQRVVQESAPGNSGNQAAPPTATTSETSGKPTPGRPTGVGTPGDLVGSECSGGSWYHKEEIFQGQGYKQCVTNSECRQADEANCCLKEFCWCGKMGPGIACVSDPGPTDTMVYPENSVTPLPTVPNPTTALPTTLAPVPVPTTASPTTLAPVPTSPSPTTALPTSPAPTEKVVQETAPGITGFQDASPTTTDSDRPAAEGSEEVPVTECSDGSWYHQDHVFSGYQKCVTTSECRKVDEADCCLKNFCFCGKVGAGGEAKACVPV